MFLKDVQQYLHLHVFSESEDNSLLMWFRQHLQWKAYPLICQDIFMCMHSPEDRWTGNWVLTVTFQQSETIIVQKEK